MRKLLIDAQVFHTPAFHRGMGKYSLEFLRALVVGDSRWDSVEIIVSSKIPLEDGASAELAEAVPGIKLTKLPLKKDSTNHARRVMDYNRAVIDRYVGDMLTGSPGATIDFLILSPMQGGVSCVFPSDPSVHKILVCYDLIPFMFHRIYFQNPIARIENLTKLTELLKADIFLTISKTVAADLARNFGIDPDRIHSIDGGPINHGLRPEAVPVKKPFILMPTGNDLRKNNRAAILGFGEFNTRHNNAYHLVITSFFDPAEMEELSKLAGNITFTGNVTGNGLAYLYETCDALLFPSKYEGLGLPVLEAVEKDKPVACSDISVFKEMSDTAFAYFDPALGTSIAKALDVAVSLKLDRQTYKRIKTEYTWQSTADKAVKAIRQHEHDNPIADKPEVAVFGLSAECNSPSAGFMQVTHAELSRFVTPRYFLEGTGGGQPAEPDVLAFLAGSQSVSTKSRVSLGDQLPIYNLFNSEHLVMTLFTALARPGVLVLHEPGLEQTWEAMARQGLVDRSRLEAEKNLQEKSGATGVNLLGSAVAAQKRIAVFSDKAATAINDLQKALGISVPVVMLPVPQNGKHGHRAFAKALSQVILEIAGGGHE